MNWQLIGNRAPVGATHSGTFGAADQGFGQAGGTGPAPVRHPDLHDGRCPRRQAARVGRAGRSPRHRRRQRQLADRHRSGQEHGPDRSPDQGIGPRCPRPAAIKVFTIVNGDARSLASMLQQLVGQQQTTPRHNTLFGQGDVEPVPPAGLQSAAGSGESSLVPVRSAWTSAPTASSSPARTATWAWSRPCCCGWTKRVCGSTRRWSTGWPTPRRPTSPKRP